MDVTEHKTAVLAAKKVEQYARELRNKNDQLARAAAAAKAATEAKSRFLAGMSHELRTPLNSIIGFSELMYDGKVGDIAEEHREFLADILTSARHLLQLINDILDLSKIESGKFEFRPEPTDISRLAHEVCDVIRPPRSTSGWKSECRRNCPR
jgi:signal transduction histidine kinase